MALITCTHCGASGNAPDHIIGQQVRCSKCKQSFLAAGAAPPPPVEEAVEEDEGFPTNDDIGAKPVARRSAARDEEPEDEPEDDEPVRRSPKRRSSGSNGFVEFVMFRRMVAPYVIMVLFWIGLILVIIGGLTTIGLGLSQGGNGIVAALIGAVYLFVGPLMVRLYCEILIVIFRINETLTDVLDELKRRN